MIRLFLCPEAETMLMKPCPRCKRMIPYGLPYCPDCQPIAEAQRAEARERKAAYRKAKYNKQYNRRRDPKYLAFYRSKDWKVTSRAKLQAAGYKCEARLEGCKGLAVEVHHIQPIQTEDGWDKRLEWSNLEAVCTVCHNARHDRRFGRNKKCDGVLDLKEIERNTKKESKRENENPGGG